MIYETIPVSKNGVSIYSVYSVLVAYTSMDLIVYPMVQTRCGVYDDTPASNILQSMDVEQTMTKIRKIDINLDERVETGPTQFGDDWPGLFIRGDNAAYYAMMLRQHLDGNNDQFGLSKAVLESLYSDLTSCRV